MMEPDKEISGSSGSHEAQLNTEERFRIISELTSDFAYAVRVEPDGQIVPEWVSDAATRITGSTAEEISAQGLKSIIHPDDWPVIRKHIKKVLSGQPDICEARLFTVTGEVRWLRDHARPVWDEAQARVVRVYGASQDITEIKQAEEVKASLAAIIESSDDAILSKDPDGIIRSWNKAAERLYGYTPEMAVGRPVSIIVPPEKADDFPRIMERLRRGEKVDHYETERMRRDGQRLYVSLTVSPIFDSSGRVIGASAIARDVTERKRAEAEREQLLASEQAIRREAEAAQKLSAELLVREHTARRAAEEANRTKDEFLAMVSHELRTPLNAILGWATMLNRSKLDESTTAQAIDAIERNAKAQSQLIEDLLDVSRIITGRMRLDVQPVELPLIIQAAVDAVAPAATAKGIQLQVLLDPNAGPVSGDPGRLQQIVWNLLSNAVKFTPKGGTVQVRLERVNSYVRITISDTGQGIKPEFLPYIFDRFRQADSSLSRVHGGLGLGLAIVRHLAELHGGKVEAQSAGEGYGSTFTVSLPITISQNKSRYGSGALEMEEPMARSNIVDCPPRLDKLRVVVVEDEPDARELLVAVLDECGAKVRAGASAAEGIELLQQLKPDVLISDIEMPHEDGYSFIRRVRALPGEEGGHVPAIALTAHARTNDRLRALSAGFDAHVTKPMDLAELVTVIASLARRVGRGEMK